MRMIVRMTQADRIISKFGGLSKLAKALGHKHPTTVQGWRVRGFVPAPQMEAVLKAARKSSIKLGPDDFFSAKPREGSRS